VTTLPSGMGGTVPYERPCKTAGEMGTIFWIKQGRKMNGVAQGHAF
jgi:hypothetical protein